MRRWRAASADEESQPPAADTGAGGGGGGGGGGVPVDLAASPPPDRPFTSSPFHFLHTVHRVPCFRDSLLWGMGVGAGMSVHSFINHRSPVRAADAAVKAFAAVSIGCWVVCRYKFKQQRNALKDLIDIQSADEDSGDALRLELKRRLQAGASKEAAGASSKETETPREG